MKTASAITCPKKKKICMLAPIGATWQSPPPSPTNTRWTMEMLACHSKQMQHNMSFSNTKYRSAAFKKKKTCACCGPCRLENSPTSPCPSQRIDTAPHILHGKHSICFASMLPNVWECYIIVTRQTCMNRNTLKL